MSACGSYAPNEHDLNTTTRSETWPDFPVPNPRGTTQTSPAPLAHPPHPPLRIALQSPLHRESLGCPTGDVVPSLLTPPSPSDNYSGFDWRMKSVGNVSQRKVKIKATIEDLAAYD